MYGLKDEHINKMLSVFVNYSEIDKVILYGSRAKGDFRNGSDIDLSLVGDELNSDILSRLESDFDDLLLPYKIDISIFNKIDNLDLISRINRIGVVLYKK